MTDRKLSSPGVRSTRQRAAVVEVLHDSAEFLSAQELHEELRRRSEDIGLATVYRALQSMASSGMVDTLRTDTGESLYRRCSEQQHHHHIVCRTCGATVEVQGKSVEAWTAKVAEQHGFSDITHTIEIFGTCKDCTGS